MQHAIITGDVEAVLQGQRAASFDACLTDPPYGLAFMGKKWDRGVPGIKVWREVRRVLKPGAFLMAFGGARTFHRLACAIEEAGFTIVDCLMWLYGSGWPKGLNISKAIAKVSAREAPRWEGYNTALKPAWEPILIATKRREGTFAENALQHGVAGLNVGPCRIGTEQRRNQRGRGTRRHKHCYDAGLRAIGPKDVEGRWPANLLLDESAAAQLDAQSEYGPVSRFFYVSKASPRDRGPENNHPTVKPTKLDTAVARYLLQLLLPPARPAGERRLIVPFAGSGSELLGARAAGWDYALGIDNDPAYVRIAKGRLAAAA